MDRSLALDYTTTKRNHFVKHWSSECAQAASRFHEHYCEKMRPQVSCSFLFATDYVTCDHYLAVSAKVLRWPQPGCSQIGIRRREFKSGGEARLPENQEILRDGMRITECDALVIAS